MHAFPSSGTSNTQLEAMAEPIIAKSARRKCMRDGTKHDGSARHRSLYCHDSIQIAHRCWRLRERADGGLTYDPSSRTDRLVWRYRERRRRPLPWLSRRCGCCSRRGLRWGPAPCATGHRGAGRSDRQRRSRRRGAKTPRGRATHRHHRAAGGRLSVLPIRRAAIHASEAT